ncbi:hypothetical protein Tco_0939467 [Tanacetum coccineum]|uniref:SHSP domain-containing protein n=1 Tax=Tanacetum coccineum TaxID=301880 RepID=A0ABQ5DMK4_9ASTR
MWGRSSYQNCPSNYSNMYHDNIQDYAVPAAAVISTKLFWLSTSDGLQIKFDLPGFLQFRIPHANSQNNFNRGNNFNQKQRKQFQNQGQANDELLRNIAKTVYLLPVLELSLPGNTITNPKEDLKGITTRSGVTIQGPKAVNHDIEVTKDTMPPANNGSTETIPNSCCSNFNLVIKILSPCAPVDTPVPKASIPFPSRRNDERRKEKANDQNREIL